VCIAVDDGNPLRSYGVARAMAVCEADNEVSRIREELDLLPREMRAHVSYYRRLAARLSKLRAALVPDSEPTAEELQAIGYTDVVLASGAVCSGALTFVRLAEVEVQQRLAEAALAFASVGVVAEAESAVPEPELDADSEDGDAAPPVDDGDFA